MQLMSPTIIGCPEIARYLITKYFLRVVLECVLIHAEEFIHLESADLILRTLGI